MSLFGSYRDARRRRTLADESAGEAVVAPAAVAPRAGVRPQRYSAGGRRENHRHTTDFIPRHGWSLGLWYFVGLTIVGGLLAGFVASSQAAIEKASSVASLLDAAHGGSLAGWFSSLVFLLAAAGSVLVYSIRRHKLDDYRGRYRLWLWSALAWLVMSIDATANLHAPFSQGMALLSGWSLAGDAAAWWIGTWGLILAILALRLVFEMRECRTAMPTILTVCSLWTAALAIDSHWLSVGEYAAPIAVGCRLVGQVTLLLAIGIFARHVLLDAEGLLTVREPKPKREKRPKKTKQAFEADEEDESVVTKTRIDSAHKPSEQLGGLHSRVQAATTSNRSATSASRSTSASSSTAANRSSTTNDENDNDDRYDTRRGSQNRYDEEDGDDDDYGSDNRKLSKAERKRLRKQLRQQRRDAEE